jgi:flagellar capping protein FliD
MAYLPPTNTYANVTIPNGGNIVGGGITYATATGVGSWVASTQAKVRITEEDIEIRGKSLATVLETLEDRLAILVPNPKLETEFEELKELAKQYRELEQKLLDQKKMWATLKKTD